MIPLKTIGVISDTHGLLRPEALEALRGCDLLVHAGDIGAAEIITSLERLAPVHAIRGNVDHDPWAERFPATAVVPIDGVQLYLLHDLIELDLDPVAAGLAVVISGHSHQAAMHSRNGVLYLNPGSAGPRRFRLPITVAKLWVGAGGPRAEIIPLPVP